MTTTRLIARLSNDTSLLIEAGSEGVFLYSQAADGTGSDTWHRTLDDAKEQAACQFGVPVEMWLSAPVDAADPFNLAREISSEHVVRPDLLRVRTSFQDTPGDGYYFVLNYAGRRLDEQLAELGLKDRGTVLLWEPDCAGSEIEAVLLVDFHHPLACGPMLWARDKNSN